MGIYKIVRILLIIIPIVALGYFGYQHVNPSGELVVDYNFCQKETPYLSGLSPHGRVLPLLTKEGGGGRCSQRMVIDPVYFDVRLSQSYEQVEINTSYLQKGYGNIFQIGVGIDPENWQWNFGLADIKTQEHKNIKTINYNIDLSEAKFDNNRYRFIISAPGLDVSGGEVEFYNMKLTFKKQALNAGNIWKRIKNFVNF